MGDPVDNMPIFILCSAQKTRSILMALQDFGPGASMSTRRSTMFATMTRKLGKCGHLPARALASIRIAGLRAR